MQSVEYLLKLRGGWQWFGTLTWRPGSLATAAKREKHVDEFLRRWAATLHGSLNAMPLAIRWELGDIGERRPHCHFLIDGFPPGSVTRNRGYKMNHLWFIKYGLARIRPFQSSQRGKCLSYITKGIRPEDDTDWRRGSANEFEIASFDKADRVIFNGALWADLQAITRTSFVVARST